MNYYPHHIGDYAKDTRALSQGEHGAYRLLIDEAYSSENGVAADEVYAISCAHSAAERKNTDRVLAKFFTIRDGRYYQKRIDEEVETYRGKSAKAKVAAQLSVEARQRQNAKLRSERMAAARAKGTHTKEEWADLVAACGNKCVRCGADGNVVKDHVVPVYQGGSDGIDNLQPLCVRCNGAKGPEDVDHVPLNVRVAFAQRSLNDGSQNAGAFHQLTNNQEPITKELLTLSGKPDLVNGKRSQAIEILDFLNAKTGRNYQPVDANLKMIAARLKEGATVDDCRAVIAMKCREWGTDEKMEEYLRPKTLFSATNFAQYRGRLADANP